MKDIKTFIIGFLTCGYLFGGIFDGVENPNGRFGLITVGFKGEITNYSGSEYNAQHLPGGSQSNDFFKWITVQVPLGYSTLTVSVPSKNNPYIQNKFDIDIDNGNINHLIRQSNKEIYSFNLDFHLPIYKLWEK